MTDNLISGTISFVYNFDDSWFEDVDEKALFLSASFEERETWLLNKVESLIDIDDANIIYNNI